MILKELIKQDKSKRVQRFIGEFRAYIENKEKDALNLKYQGKELNPDYYFLTLKLKAVEKAILKELGSVALKEIKDLYEQEMMRRILEERQEKR